MCRNAKPPKRKTKQATPSTNDLVCKLHSTSQRTPASRTPNGPNLVKVTPPSTKPVHAQELLMARRIDLRQAIEATPSAMQDARLLSLSSSPLRLTAKWVGHKVYLIIYFGSRCLSLPFCLVGISSSDAC